MKQKLIDLMADILEADSEELSLETDFREEKYDFDSLKGYAILLYLENDYGIKVGVDEFIASKTIGDLLACIESKMEKQS
jgi:acyl carrier protein